MAFSLTTESPVPSATLERRKNSGRPLPSCTPKTSYPRFSGRVSGRRYFSPPLGRWLSKDPVAEKGNGQIRGAATGNIADIASLDLLGSVLFVLNAPSMLVDYIGLGGGGSVGPPRVPRPTPPRPWQPKPPPEYVPLPVNPPQNPAAPPESCWRQSTVSAKPLCSRPYVWRLRINMRWRLKCDLPQREYHVGASVK